MAADKIHCQGWICVYAAVNAYLILENGVFRPASHRQVNYCSYVAVENTVQDAETVCYQLGGD